MTPYEMARQAALQQAAFQRLAAYQAMQQANAYQAMQQANGGIAHGQYWRAGSSIYGSSAHGAYYHPGLGTVVPAGPFLSTSGAAFVPDLAPVDPEAAERAREARRKYNLGPKYDGMKVGEIIAWRCWRVMADGFLQSMAVDTVWFPNQAVTGILDHGNGVHAFKAPDQCREYLGGQFCVIGTVKLWGTVVEHTGGYRAENAKIASLDFVMNDKGLGFPLWRLFGGPTLAKLRAAYGVGAHDAG